MRPRFGQMAIGLFRDADGWARVRLTDGREIDVPRRLYVAAKHEPKFEDLPHEAEVDERRDTASP